MAHPSGLDTNLSAATGRIGIQRLRILDNAACRFDRLQRDATRNLPGRLLGALGGFDSSHADISNEAARCPCDP
jgi:hypothetical protein